MSKNSTRLLLSVLFICAAAVGYLRMYSYSPPQSEHLIYESSAESENECTSYEKYDTESKTCYYACKDESECAQIETEIENELASWTDDYSAKKHSDEKPDVNQDEFVKASYTVSNTEKITLAKGADDDEYRTIWNRISQLSPNNISDRYISEYQVFDNPEDDTQAFVDDPDGDGRWRIAVNLSGYRVSDPKERSATLIHELGHIITLNTSQVVPGADQCHTYAIDEGCSKADSYLYLFVSRFWKNEPQPVYDPTKFVTEYAATSDVEDLAESFAFYVLEKTASGTAVKDQKLTFFAAHPDLVSIRAQMRKVLTKDIIRARKGK